MNHSKPAVRMAVLIGILSVILVLFTVRLVKLQIIDGETYKNAAEQGSLAKMSVEAVRGEILDRNGQAITTNREGYNVVFYRALMEKDTENDILLRLRDVLAVKGEKAIDNLPLNETGSDFSEVSVTTIERVKTFLGLQKWASADNVFEALIERYDLQDFTITEQRYLAGVRYEMEYRGFSNSTPYTYAEDVSIDTVSRIKENAHLLKGVDIVEAPVREYVNADLMPHIAGLVGPLYAEEYAEKKEEGYALNDVIGKFGIEEAMESVLRGHNGTTAIEFDSKGNVISQKVTDQAIPGNTVKLSLDNNLQQIAYDALKLEIEKLNQTAKEGMGKEANAGCVVAVDTKTGKILCSVNFPTYDYETYRNDYASLLNEDLNKPLLNRAFNGVYAPGSSFKPLVALSSLNEGVISRTSTVNCQHTYRYYSDYQPTCLGYHGNINVVKAIQESCNIFFYDVGRRLGLENIASYAQAFGLGEKTGVEISESLGQRPSREDQIKREGGINPGYTLQSAIGQGGNLYTPLQLASYVCTIANRGTRYRLSLIDSIWTYNLDEKVQDVEPEVLSTLELEDEVWDAVQEGMVAVSRKGSAKYTFANYPLDVASKTGTPETSAEPNSVFVSYAPAQDPQIAVVVIIEKGYYGYHGANVAKAIYDAYFFPSSSDNQAAESSSGTSVNETSQQMSSANEAASSSETSSRAE